jgi:hypothetical protein
LLAGTVLVATKASKGIDCEMGAALFPPSACLDDESVDLSLSLLIIFPAIRQ